MVPDDMLQKADEQNRLQFFELMDGRWTIKQRPPDAAASSSTTRPPTPVVPSENPIASLKDVVEKEASKKKKTTATEQSARQYNLFVDLIYKMLSFRPTERVSPMDALAHPFISEK
jgi:dual specificity tyrosine-phosphorylation-regulated kinase 1